MEGNAAQRRERKRCEQEKERERERERESRRQANAGNLQAWLPFNKSAVSGARKRA